MTELLIEFDIIFWIIELGAYFCSYRVCFPYAYRVCIMGFIELGNCFSYRVCLPYAYRVWIMVFIELENCFLIKLIEFEVVSVIEFEQFFYRVRIKIGFRV